MNFQFATFALIGAGLLSACGEDAGLESADSYLATVEDAIGKANFQRSPEEMAGLVFCQTMKMPVIGDVKVGDDHKTVRDRKGIDYYTLSPSEDTQWLVYTQKGTEFTRMYFENNTGYRPAFALVTELANRNYLSLVKIGSQTASVGLGSMDTRDEGLYTERTVTPIDGELSVFTVDDRYEEWVDVEGPADQYGTEDDGTEWSIRTIDGKRRYSRIRTFDTDGTCE